MSDELLVTDRGAVRIMSLNRPDRINAVTPALAAALHGRLEAAAADSACRAILLRGEGRGFCSGQDLSLVPDAADLGDLLERQYAPVIRLIRTVAKPVLCAVHGVAAGAGANLALACDIVLAARSARFIQSFVRIGLIPDVGGTWLLPRLAGAARARAMAMLGEPVLATDAAEWGLIWRAIPDDELMAEAEGTAAQLAALPTHAIGLIKRALDAAETNTLAQQLDLEAGLQRQAGFTADFREGVQAFLDKRPPRFTGSGA